jgi:hypothetical protein
VKKCFQIKFFAFFEEIHGMCQHRPIIIFHILLGNVYNLFE